VATDKSLEPGRVLFRQAMNSNVPMCTEHRSHRLYFAETPSMQVAQIVIQAIEYQDGKVAADHNCRVQQLPTVQIQNKNEEIRILCRDKPCRAALRLGW
jgi:hypothetical protein